MCSEVRESASCAWQVLGQSLSNLLRSAAASCFGGSQRQLHSRLVVAILSLLLFAGCHPQLKRADKKRTLIVGGGDAAAAAATEASTGRLTNE